MSWVWENGPSEPTERLVLLALADFANDDGMCWPSMESIGSKAAMTDRGARGIVRRLQAAGWLSVEVGGGRGGCSRYTIRMEKAAPSSAFGSENPEQETGNTVPPLGTPCRVIEPETRNVTTETRNVVHETRNAGSAEPSRTIRDPEEEKIPPYSPDEEFERIWPHYPKRVEKADARKAWLAARRTHSFEEIAAPLREYIRLRKGEDPQFTISLGRWLKRERWTDEVPHGANRARSSTEDLRGLATVSAADDLARLWGPIERKAIGQ